MELAFADHHLMGLWDWQKVVSLEQLRLMVSLELFGSSNFGDSSSTWIRSRVMAW